jgi:putative transposase
LFNGRLRDACLREECVFSLDEARRTLQCWRQAYNVCRPHSALQDRTPAELAARWTTAAMGLPKIGPAGPDLRRLVETLT